MEKTIFRLDKEISIMILSAITILFSFLSSYSTISNLFSFISVLLKSLIFVIIPLIIYVLEKNSLSLKKIAGIYAGYFIINLFVTIGISFSFINNSIYMLFKMLFDLVNLFILLSALFILIEQALNYSGVKSKIYSDIIMKFVYLIGTFVSNPFLIYINKKLKKKEDINE